MLTILLNGRKHWVNYLIFKKWFSFFHSILIPSFFCRPRQFEAQRKFLWKIQFSISISISNKNQIFSRLSAEKENFNDRKKLFVLLWNGKKKDFYTMVMSLWKTRFSYLCHSVTSPNWKYYVRFLSCSVDCAVNGYHHHFTRHYVMNWNQTEPKHEHCFHFTS